MKKYLSALLLLCLSVQAGLPPTVSKTASDASNTTTFSFQFPNFTSTRTGAALNLGVLGIAGGGTGTTTGHSILDLPLTGGTMSGSIDMGSNLISSLLDPVSNQDAATKNYVLQQVGNSAIFLQKSNNLSDVNSVPTAFGNIVLNATVTNAKLAVMGASTVKANITSGSASPTDIPLSSSNTAFSVVVRDGSGGFSAGTINANLTGTASNVTTNANLTGPITSVGNATSIASQTGTGTKFVVDTSPTLVTPNLGTPTALVATNATGTASGLNIGGNAATATALASAPSGCSAGQFVTQISTNGTPTCSTPAGGSGASSYVYAVSTVGASTYTFAFTDGTGNGNNPFIQFTAATQTIATIPTNASVPFGIGTEIKATQDGAGAIVYTPAVGVTMNSLSSRNQSSGQYSVQRLLKLGTNVWSLFDDITSAFIVATGGTITTDGNFKVHTFNSSGTFTITSGYEAVASLVIAGGGSGASGAGGSASGGGGGAGGMLYTPPGPGTALGVGGYTVIVGAGGSASGGGVDGFQGSNSVFNTLTATGGGGGTGGAGSTGANLNGGSGGGGGSSFAGGTAVSGQGNKGGDASGAGACGGGGAGAAGANCSNSLDTSGGNGSANSITGSSVTYAGGGGGGHRSNTTVGGTGGGGAGGTTDNSPGTAGTANTGGGGGGGGLNGGGRGAGGSGVVIIRYQFQ